MKVLLDIDVGAGWKATEAQLPSGATSIALLTFKKATDARFARLDIDKAMMVDSPPRPLSAARLRTIVAEVADRFNTAPGTGDDLIG